MSFGCGGKGGRDALPRAGKGGRNGETLAGDSRQNQPTTEDALLQPGDEAPSFRVKDHEGNEVALEDFRGKKVLLWFYPKADTPGCTIEGRALRDKYDEIQALGLVVLGVSFDTPEENKAFAEKYSFPFPLLCDTERELGLAFGACDDKGAEYARRISYVIDEEGRIAFAYPKVTPTTHADEVIRDVKGE